MLHYVFRGTDVLTKAFADDELSFTEVFFGRLTLEENSPVVSPSASSCVDSVW